MLVRESLYNFKRNQDVVSSSGLGVKQKIEEWLLKNGLSKAKINGDFTIDVNGDLSLNGYEEAELPYYIQFNKVSRDVQVIKTNLQSLRGMPKIIKGSFLCTDNNLISLKNGPEYVEMTYRVDKNNLTSLEGCTQNVGGDFSCSYNKLENLNDIPPVLKSFYCVRNEGKRFTKQDVMQLCDVKREILV